MDLNALLRLVFLEKNDITVGVLMGLLLIVVISLLIRSVLQEKSMATSGVGSSAIDTKVLNIAIEGAVKKAMSDQPMSVGSGSGATPAGVEFFADSIALKKTLNEREAKIAALMSDLEALKSQMDAQPVSSGALVGASEDSSGLQSKIKELQTKLAEYEIIEDDIADLSLFKEENKKLKAELEKLRAGMETAQTQVQAVQTAVSAAPTNAVRQAQAAVVDVAQVSETPPPARPPPEPFKLDTEDDVMGEFAQALSGSKAPAEVVFESTLISGSGAPVADPRAALDALFEPPKPETPHSEAEISAKSSNDDVGDMFGELDTEKMLAEVTSLKEASHGESDAGSVLDEQLDTDRLMAEMGMAEAPAPAAAPAPVAGAELNEAPVPVAAVVSTPTTEPVAPRVVATAEIDPNDVPVDDLLAEFKDMDYQSGKKGS